MGKMQREKGARGERALVKALKTLGFVGAKRRGGQQAADPGDAPDVRVDRLRVWIECKVGARPNAAAALRQAEEASLGTGEVPVAITKADGKPWNVTLRLMDLKRLCNELNRYQMDEAIDRMLYGEVPADED